MQHLEPAAKLYARALFSLATEQGTQDKLYSDLQEFSSFLKENQDLSDVLNGQVFLLQERESVLNTVAEKTQLNPLIARLAGLLVARNRLTLLSAIEWEYRKLLDSSQGLVRGTVTTVEALSDAERQDLEKTFSKKLGKKVVLEQQTEKEILGGLVVSVQGRTFDGSLKTTLRRLTENLER